MVKRCRFGQFVFTTVFLCPPLSLSPVPPSIHPTPGQARTRGAKPTRARLLVCETQTQGRAEAERREVFLPEGWNCFPSHSLPFPSGHILRTPEGEGVDWPKIGLGGRTPLPLGGPGGLARNHRKTSFFIRKKLFFQTFRHFVPGLAKLYFLPDPGGAGRKGLLAGKNGLLG